MKPMRLEICHSHMSAERCNVIVMLKCEIITESCF